MVDNWSACNEEFTISDLRLAIKYRLTKFIRDELDDRTEDYCSITYEDWCELLSTIDVKYERKRSVVHINKMASTRSAYKYDSDYSASIPRRRKAKTGVLRSNKIPRRSHDRHHGVHCYCVLCKKSVMPERKYPTHSSKDCTGVRTKRPIKDGMGGTILNRINALQQYKKSENKWKTELKALKKQHKMIYIIAKKSGSRREIQ